MNPLDELKEVLQNLYIKKKVGSYTKEEIDKAFDSLKGEKGDKGEPGETGKPFKFEDLTKAQLDFLILQIVGKIPRPNDGTAPQKGVDYFTKEEIESVQNAVITALQSRLSDLIDYSKIEDIYKYIDSKLTPETLTGIEIVDLLEGLEEEDKLEVKALKDFAEEVKKLIPKQSIAFIGGNAGGGGSGGAATWGSIGGTLADQSDLQTALDAKVDANASITGATKTKITYDAKGLVTAGTDATTADIAPSTDRNYVTDAQLVVIGNTSGVNTGDQDLSGYATIASLGDLAFLDTITATLVTDFDTEVSNNTDVAANTAARHAAVTVLDSSEIDFTLTGQQITASLVGGSIDESKLDSSVNASLDLADSALQSSAICVSIQAYDPTLAALAAYNTNGLLTQTAADTFVGRTLTGTANQITVSDGDGVAGNPTLSLPSDVIIPTIITAPNTGLHLLDTDASHDLIIKPGSNLTADKTFTITTGDNNRTLNISAADVTISSYITDLLSAANQTAANIAIGLTIGGTVEAHDATLTALAGANWAANSLAIGSGADTVAQVTFAANTFPARASTGNLVAKTITDFGLSLVDDADSATARTTLGLAAGGAGDIWVEKAGDTMTGQLFIDGGSDQVQLLVQGNATQTNFVALFENSGGTDLAWIDNNGRITSVAATSSGFAIGSTPNLTIVHTGSAGTYTNATGDLNFNGAVNQSVFFNSGGIDINHIFRTNDDNNALNIDGGLNTLAIGDSPASVKKLTIAQTASGTGNPTTLVVKGTHDTAAATTLKGATYDLFFTHATGTTSGGNVTEYNWTISGGGTVGTVEGVNMIGNLTNSSTATTVNYIHLYAPNVGVGSTLGTLNALKVDAGNAIFNDNQGDYDFRVEGDSISHHFFLDATSTTENAAFFATAAPNWQSMDRGFFIGNADAAPSGNPSSGGFLYVESGALKYRGSSGTVTTLGAA